MKRTLLFTMLAMGLFSCTKSDVNELIATSATPGMEAGREGDPTTCEPTTTSVALLAGQTNLAGDVSVVNDGTNLTVTYNTTGTWSISAVHLYVGEYALAPQNNGGNPMPGRFPIHAGFTTPVTTWSHVIPLTDLPECFIVAAHSVLKSSGGGSQTGWGQGTQFDGNNWGMYFEVCAAPCP